ncbi:MAG: hypothetical protein IPM29_23145 [Planctomycetes bacterium]|nr:hypothetical protein [Planctomycetota bacterium]
MTGSTVPPPLPAGSAAGGRPLPFAERLSDRINPILVREVQQALYGRAFFGLLMLSTLAVTVLGFAFVAMQEDRDPDVGVGRNAFTTTLASLVPIAMLLIPAQSFQSMRNELQGGVAEQLALTRIRPRGVVTGKILAGTVQLLLVLAMFAPVLALTFLLRGIDVPTIAVSLLLLVCLGFGANAFTVGAAAVTGTRVTRQLMHALTIVGLVIGTFWAVRGATVLPGVIAGVLDDEDALIALMSFGFFLVVGSALWITIGIASLSHEYENRSTPFRVLALVVAGLSLSLLPATLRASVLREAAYDTAATLALLLGPVWGFASCENPRMSPRVRAHVPRRRVAAILAAPFLPGAPRGAAFTLLLAVVTVGFAELVASLSTQPSDRRGEWTMGGAWAYALFFSALAVQLRRLQPAGGTGSKRAFGLLMLIVVMGMLAPWMVQILLRDDVTGDWNPTHAFNATFTARYAASDDRAATLVVGLGVLGLVGTLVPGVHGVRAVLAERRSRAARREVPVAR